MRQFAAEQIRVRVERVEAEIARTRESDDEEAVHDLRVSIRRLRAALRLLGPLFRGGRVRRLNRVVRERMRLAGEVRNRDIAAALARQAGIADGEEIAQRLEAERAALAPLLRDIIEATPELELPKPSSDRRAARSMWDVNESAAANASRVLPRLAGAFFHAGDRTLADPAGATAERLHALRLAAKRFRYSLEVFSPLYGEALQRRIDTLKEIQTALGDLNDLETALTFEAVASSPGMTEWIGQRRAELLGGFHDQWAVAASAAAVEGWRKYLARFARPPKAAAQASR